MALTESQKAEIRRYAGWSARFHQTDSRLEMAMLALESTPEHEAQITNALAGSPPGLLAQLADIDAKIAAATSRLKASKVGSIELNPAEMYELRRIGRQFATRLCSILGVERRTDAFGAGGTSFGTFGGPESGSGNYVGK